MVEVSQVLFLAGHEAIAIDGHEAIAIDGHEAAAARRACRLPCQTTQRTTQHLAACASITCMELREQQRQCCWLTCSHCAQNSCLQDNMVYFACASCHLDGLLSLEMVQHAAYAKTMQYRLS